MISYKKWWCVWYSLIAIHWRLLLGSGVQGRVILQLVPVDAVVIVVVLLPRQAHVNFSALIPITGRRPR